MHLSSNVYSLALVSSNPADDGNGGAGCPIFCYVEVTLDLMEADTHDPVFNHKYPNLAITTPHLIWLSTVHFLADWAHDLGFYKPMHAKTSKTD
jgi:hypothetical protein